MLRTLLTMTAVTAVLGACTPDSSAPVTAAPQASVMAPLVGKQLVTDSVTFIVGADGTMGGTFKGEPVVGTYTATATESCSIYTSPEALTGREFCSVPVITGNTVVFNRRDGSVSPAYSIQG